VDKTILTIDIGTTKIVSIIAKNDNNKKINILGVGKSVSNGIKKGTIVDINLASESIKNAIEVARSSSTVSIDKTIVSISGIHTISRRSVGSVNIPSGYMVFLEDRSNNTFTRLDDGSTYKTTLNADSNGIGRFYVHTATERLKVANEVLQNISVYTKNNTLVMAGLPQGNTTVSLFSILGKKVLHTSFNSTGFKELTVPSLAKGVYIVQLATEKGSLNKKVIIE